MKKLNNKGFTLMELIIVIAIIAVLMLILVPTMGGFVDSAKEEALRANAKAAYTAAVAQQTAADAGLTAVNGGSYALNGETDCNKLHSDFYDVVEEGTCVISYEDNRVESVTFTSGTDSATYPN